MNLAAVLFRRRESGKTKSELSRLSPSELHCLLLGAEIAKGQRGQSATVILIADEVDRELIAYCRAFGLSEAIFVATENKGESNLPWGVAELVTAINHVAAQIVLVPQYPQGINVIDPSPVASSLLGYEYIANVSNLSIDESQIRISQSLPSSEITFVSERPIVAAMVPTAREQRPKVSSEIAARALEVTALNAQNNATHREPLEVGRAETFVKPSIRSAPEAAKASLRRDQLMEGPPKISKIATAIDPKDGASLILEKLNEVRR